MEEEDGNSIVDMLGINPESFDQLGRLTSR